MSFKFIRQPLCITAIVLSGIPLLAQDGHWKFILSSDPLDKSKMIEARLTVRAEGAGGVFQAKATCNDGLIFNIDYFGSLRGAPVTYLIDGNGFLTESRIALDGHLRVAEIQATSLGNRVKATISSAEAYPHRNSVHPGVTPQDVLNAKSFKIELPLNNGEKAIIELHPADPDFHKFASECGSKLDRQPSALQASLTDAFQKTMAQAMPDPNKSLSDDYADVLKAFGQHPDPTAIPSPKPNVGPVYTHPVQPNAATDNPLAAGMANLPPGSAILKVNSSFQTRNPLVEVNYYLMRDDFATTLTKSGYPVPPSSDPGSVYSQFCGRPDQTVRCTQMFQASRANPVAIKQCDLKGNAIIGPVAPGEYYLLIFSRGVENTALYWNQKLTLTAGANSFTAGVENSKRLR